MIIYRVVEKGTNVPLECGCGFMNVSDAWRQISLEKASYFQDGTYYPSQGYTVKVIEREDLDEL